jgi:hypothetical protein
LFEVPKLSETIFNPFFGKTKNHFKTSSKLSNAAGPYDVAYDYAPFLASNPSRAEYSPDHEPPKSTPPTTHAALEVKNLTLLLTSSRTTLNY